MTLEQMIREWKGLPPQARQEVADFIAFLYTRHTSTQPETEKVPTRIEDEPYVGMWQDRADMADSSAWARGTRARDR